MTSLLLPQSGLKELTIEEILRRKAVADARMPSHIDPLDMDASLLPPDDFRVEREGKHYRLKNLVVEDKVYQCLWSGSLLRGGVPGYVTRHTLNGWTPADYRKIDGTLFDIPSGPEYGAVIMALYRHRNARIDPAQRMLLDEFKESLLSDMVRVRLMTSTQVNYARESKPPNKIVDHVMHSRYRADAYEHDAFINGQSQPLDVFMSMESGALLGMNDARAGMETLKWFSGKDAYLSRHKSSPSGRLSPIMLYAGHDYFEIDAVEQHMAEGHAYGIKVLETSPVVRR